LEKEKITEQSSQQYTDTPSEAVYRSNFVYKSYTDQEEIKFKNINQRLERRQLRKISEIATKYGKKKFSETIDILLFCYDFLEGVSNKYKLSGVGPAAKFIEKHLPVNDFELIVRKVVELLDEIGVNGKDRVILEKELISILKSVKLDKKSASEVLKPLILIRGGSSR